MTKYNFLLVRLVPLSLFLKKNCPGCWSREERRMGFHFWSRWWWLVGDFVLPPKVYNAGCLYLFKSYLASIWQREWYNDEKKEERAVGSHVIILLVAVERKPFPSSTCSSWSLVEWLEKEKKKWMALPKVISPVFFPQDWIYATYGSTHMVMPIITGVIHCLGESVLGMDPWWVWGGIVIAENKLHIWCAMCGGLASAREKKRSSFTLAGFDTFAPVSKRL